MCNIIRISFLLLGPGVPGLRDVRLVGVATQHVGARVPGVPPVLTVPEQETFLTC